MLYLTVLDVLRELGIEVPISTKALNLPVQIDKTIKSGTIYTTDITVHVRIFPQKPDTSIPAAASDYER